MGATATIRNFFLHRKKRIKAESEYIPSGQVQQPFQELRKPDL